MTDRIEVLRGLVAFLNGEAPLDGCWFGEDPPPGQGHYWWRKHLNAALAALSAQAGGQTDEKGRPLTFWGGLAQPEAQAGGICENCGGDGFVVGYHDPFSRGDVSSPFDMPCPECAAPSQPNASEAQASASDEVRQPDGYAYRYRDAWGSDRTVIKFNDGRNLNDSPPIEAVPYYLGTPPPGAVPAGWKLVPMEPTPEQKQAGAPFIGERLAEGMVYAEATYRAMLAAAPGPKE